MTPKDLHGALLDSLLELAWRQWSALGVAGIRVASESVVDPEALLVATMSIGRWDARLFDEVLDWVVANNTIVDAARLRRLARDSAEEQQRLVAVVSHLASEGEKRVGLKRVETDLISREEGVDYGTQPLFHSSRSVPENWVPEDEVFAGVGFSRSAPELRGMSQQPDTSNPACLRFKARALVGLGARAEVLSYLWTHEWAHGRLIAQRGAYNQSPVAGYLTALCNARLAEKRVDGRRTEYRLTEELRGLGTPTPHYVAWDAVWPALAVVAQALDSTTSLSDEALWSRLATSLDTARKGLAAEGFAVHVPDLTGWALRGPSGLEAMVREIADRARELGE
ncbi:MAG: hypothetical protein Q8K99_06715 [Actinomycetota bacterium]|nr:hypothetical protein [Actinomycetota bacterium]